ncbi:MAG: hypothetical protein ACOCWR_03580 [Oceanidesulfovibrio sp.]
MTRALSMLSESLPAQGAARRMAMAARENAQAICCGVIFSVPDIHMGR